jgi:hypothetical protein
MSFEVYYSCMNHLGIYWSVRGQRLSADEMSLQLAMIKMNRGNKHGPYQHRVGGCPW